MPNSNQNKICFPNENTFSVISEILEQNGLQEDPIDAVFKESVSFIGVVYGGLNKFANQQMSEEDFSRELQAQLSISKDVSKKIIADLKEKIIPFAEKIEDTEGEWTKKLPITSSPIQVDAKNYTTKIIPPKKQQRIGKSVSSKEINPQLSKQKGIDNYREPIG